MPKVRAGGRQRWVQRASVATDDYKAGINNPQTDWQSATLAAAPVQAAAVQKAISEQRYAKGVAAAGNERWKRKAATKGAERFASGVAEAEADYEKAVAPYIQTIESTQLPARGPKGDPKNIARVAVLAKAMHEKKRSL